MAVIVRTVFNNQSWNGQCQNADRDRRLFQCRAAVIDIDYKLKKSGQCAAPCWEQNLCSTYVWYSTTGDFGERATGNVYFVYRDIDQSLVLWGKSEIKKAEGKSLTFKKFKPLSEGEQVRGLTYKYLEDIGVPKWGSGTFRYISDEVANTLDALISVADGTFADPSEEAWDTEGRSLLRRHVTKERSAKLIRVFKAQLTDYSCAVCGFSFQRAYGTLGAGFIEAHHTTPIATLTEQTKMSVSDLIAVCSNCHRMLHRSNPPLSTEELQSEIESAAQPIIPPGAVR
jgi:hypothetical protein